eukprot:c8942_g1_i1 orf=557-1831(+)
MNKRARSFVKAAIVVVLVSFLPTSVFAAGTVVGFYNEECPTAEKIVQATVQNRYNQNQTITPALLRMLFHDCFVRGCDASILIDSTPGNKAEKDGRPNLTIRGFDLIEEAKAAVEQQCPGIVSCADIIAFAVRDAVVLAGGPHYEVPSGRRDGIISLETDAATLPSPDFPLEQARESFFEKGLNNIDYVALLGAHTVGSALCGFFSERVFDFRGTGNADPAMNTNLATKLSGVCPNPFFTESNADPPVFLDQGTPSIFDSNFYNQLLLGNGILGVDQGLTGDNITTNLVRHFTNRRLFFQAFVQSIIKMSNIQVLTGSQGEIRHKCNAVNSSPNTRPASATQSKRFPARSTPPTKQFPETPPSHSPGRHSHLVPEVPSGHPGEKKKAAVVSSAHHASRHHYSCKECKGEGHHSHRHHHSHKETV